jgi:chromosome segregation ATPase
MNQTDLQTLLIKRLDVIQDKITDIGERLGTLDGKIIMIQEKISSLEDKIEASENEGKILRGKQQENELRFSDIAREISAIRNSIERQEGEIKRINEEIKEMKDNVRPLMALADAINRLYKSATYAVLVALVVGVLYLLFSDRFGIVRPIIEIFMKGGGPR